MIIMYIDIYDIIVGIALCTVLLFGFPQFGFESFVQFGANEQ